MAEDIRISVGADTTQMESQIANAARKASVVIRPTIDSKGLEKISAPLGRITGQADEFSKSMEAANARVLAFGASVGVLNAVAKSFQNIVTASTQVEASLKEIQVATGETSGNLEKLGKGIFEVARSTGLSFKQASEATLEFARQGGTLEDSLMKAKAALVLTRTTGLDAAEAVKGLTAAVLSFNQVGLDYETVVNKLAAVDTKFAVSSRDLIEGISRSASVAQEAGVSFDELTALITTLQEKTARGGAVIGNALKTIFQRVQTTENLDYIRNLGIAVNDVSGDILPATTIIKKLADEFQNLDSATRKGLLIKIGGGFQIDKLAALLNDISNANGTFNRSLEQSSNAGNQGFRKLEELNKTVQASFDRLTTSGTQFAATVGKIAFSDDFRSILNKTSSFLESLNESISGGEEGGATIGKSIVKGIGSIITGPGALLLAGLGIKLFGDLAKFGVDSLKNQLGVTNVKKEQQDIEKSILGLLLQNTAVQTKIVSLEGNKTAQAEYLLGLYSKQAATLEKMSKLSKDIGPSVYEGGIRLTTEGTKNVKSKTAAGGYMSKDAARKMEMQEAPAGASIREISNFNFGPTEGKGTMIVNSMESVYKTPMGDFVVPSYSKTRTGKPTLFSASGYVPNFAEEKQKENLLRNLNIDGGAYSFAGLTIGGTGSKAVRAKEVTPQILSQIKDPVLSEALSKYSKLNFSNVSVGNIYRRRDENLDSLQASEKDIKDHFVKKANSALSPQIGTFIKDELSSLGVKPTATMQYMMKNGRKFDFVNDSMAGTFFETMLKMANMSAEDDNFGQFFNDSNSRFDIYGLKPDIAEQYGLPKKFWEYVEIKSSEKALNDEIGTKFIQQLSQAGGESLKSKFLAQAKTGAKGYVPNFAKEKISALKKGGKGGGNLGFYYDDGAKESDDYLESGNVTIKRKKNSKNATVYRKEAKNLIEKARKIGNYSEIENDYGSYLSPKFEYNKILDPNTKESSLGGLVSNLQGAIAEKEFKDQFAAYVKVEDFNAGIDFHDSNKKRLVEIKARKAALGQKEANNKVLAFLGSQEKRKRKNNQSENLDSLLSDIDFTVYESNYDLKTAAKGYVPNFAGTTNFEGSASRYGYKIGQVYNKGEEAIKATFNNPTTAFSGTVTGKESYGRKYGVTVDEKGIIASILGNNTFVAGVDQRRELESLATRLSAQGAMAKGSGFNIAGLQGGRLATNPDQVITANIKGKFKKIDYEKLDKIFPRFWKSKGLGDVWEKTKLAATYKASPTSYSEIIKDRPDLQETLSSSNLLRQNNTLLRDAAVEAVLKRDPSVAGFLVDIANSSDEAFLKQQGYGDVGIKYAMPFSGKPFSDIENKAVKEEKIQSQLDAKRKADRYKNEIESFKKYGLDYKIYGPSKEKYKALGTWGNYDPVSKKIFLLSETARTAAKGYVPNFASEDVDGDGTVTRSDPFIKRLMDSAKKFSPIAKELTNNIIGNLLNMPEGVDLFEIIEQLKLAQKANEPLEELNRIKREARLKRKNEKREEFLKRYKGPPEGSASRGYIPNFSKEAVLDAIGREQKESGLPLSAIKVVQDARVRGPRNPDGYAVINNRDEPDGKVPNFAAPSGMDPELIAAIEQALNGLKNSSLSLDEGFKRIAQNLGVSGDAINQVFDKITSSGNGLTETNQKVTQSSNQNADQANKDAENKKGANEKETKTVQDSLYTLLKWQTVIAGVTGALSAFGGDIAKGSEAVGSLVSSFISVREGKGIAGEFLGKNKQGEQASIRDAFKGNIEGKGALAGVGAIIATGGTYIAAGVAAVQALDGAIQILANTSEKSQAAIEELSALNDKYNAGLTESQKRISANIAEAGKVSGAGIGGFLNRTGISTIFSSADIQELTKTVSAAQTGRNEQSSEVLVKSFSDRLIPIVEQRMREQNPGVEKFSTSAVRENVNFTIVKMLKDIEQQSTTSQSGLRPRDRKSAGNTEYEIERDYAKNFEDEKKLVRNEQELKKIKEEILKLDQKAAQNGYRKPTDQSKYNSLLKDAKKIEEEISKITTATGVDEKKRQELIVKYLKDLERPAQELAYAEATRQEAMLINANLLKAEIDASTKLAQLEISRISPRENALSIERELLSTSETRRAAVELELKQLEEQRRLRAEIKNIAATTGQERVNQYIGFTGSTLTEQRSEEIKGSFQKIITAPAGEENKAIEDFLKILQPIKQDQETLTKQVRDRVDLLKTELEKASTGSALDKDKISAKQKEITAEENKLQVMNAQNEIGRQLLAIFTLQVDVAKKTSEEREKSNAREALNKAIVDQQNNALKMQKDILTTRLDLEQKSLQYNRERLGILRDIADINFERSTLEMPEGPMKDYLSALQQASSQAQKAFDELENRKKEKSLTDEKALTSYITGNTNDLGILTQAANAKGNTAELRKIAESAIDAQNATFEDKVINAATEFEKIVTRAGNTVAGNTQANAQEKKTITSESSLSDVLQTDYTKMSDVKQLTAAKSIIEKNDADSPEKYKEINDSLEKAIKLKEEYKKRTVENLFSGDIPTLETVQKINNQYALLLEKAEQKKRLETGVSGGLEASMKQINQDIDGFSNKLGRQIPFDFRNGLVDAMKALSDPNATNSLKERLMGVATSFLNKINEAFMQNTANKITQNIGNFFNQSGGGQGFASGGAIKGGSGTKDDVPAMLMGGEYVIRKNVVNKYGKDFFDRLNAGKVKGFANGGMAGFDIADNKDTVLNPTKYTPYGQTRAGGLSFDDNGKVIGMDSYTGTEQNKNKALLEAQTKFYQGGAQTGEGGFFMPGTYGKGAIMGQQNLLSYATQQTTGTQFDKFSNTGGGSSIDIAAGSSNLSLFALRDQGNLKNAQYLESKNKALDLYFGGIGAEKDKIKMDEENRKQYEELKKQIEDAKKQAKKQLVTQLVSTVAMAAISAAGSAMAKGWSATNQASGGKATFGEKFSGMFTGGTMGGESRGGLANMFSSSGYKDFSVIGKDGGGLREWNSSLGGYTDMTSDKYESMYQPLQNAGRLSYDSLGSPVINSFRGPSSGFNLSKINPANWFGGGGTSGRSMRPMGGFDASSMGFGGITSDQAFPSPLDSVVGMTEKQKRDYIRSQTVRKAAGGTIQGNGMGDNVPAMLNGGEFVMSRQASQRIGYGNLQQMNSSNTSSADSEGIVSRLESKLEELIEKVTGVGTINISVTSDGKGRQNESEDSNNQDQQNREMARRMKEVVLGVLRDEKRLGGLLR